MGNSSSVATTNQFTTDAKEPLVSEADLSIVYGALQEQMNDSRYIGNSSLLDPSGHLSKELQEVLDDEFMKYSKGLLVITRSQLKEFMIACYPQLFPLASSSSSSMSSPTSKSINNNNNNNNIQNNNINNDMESKRNENENEIETDYNSNDNNNEFYSNRVNYILSRYGKPFKDVRNHFAKILNIQLPAKKESVEESDPLTSENKRNDNENTGPRGSIVTMIDSHTSHTTPTTSSSNLINSTHSLSRNGIEEEEDTKEREARIVKESLNNNNNNNNNSSNNNSNSNASNTSNVSNLNSQSSSSNNNNNNNSNNLLQLKRPSSKQSNKSSKKDNNNNGKPGGHSVSIQEDENVIEKTIYCKNIDENEIVLPKTKFLLFYRKSCFDREMMVRLELNELGYSQFRGMLVDRSKSIDVLAYKVQQYRNQEQTHLEEKDRINKSMSAAQCSDMIKNYIDNHVDPFDLISDSDNLYRKRRPVKFSKCCYTMCPCIVCLARCCC